ncbi:ribonuclease H [Caulobacter sp. NIBR2454]|uniref:ribonuclease H n=1 Tax=Caulobacter sp. NIBR2454 TaxID=3015996 RepID=UPI0022B63120|nr:ribonuclease H [Caulobacter sp. NIBR2454]
MSVSLWTAGSVTGPPGYGGWSFVVVQDGVATGAAGGERRTTLRRMQLTGLIEALKSVPVGKKLIVHCDDVAIAQIALTRLAAKPVEAEEGDLWALIDVLLAPRREALEFRRMAIPGGSHGFVSAWADQARDKTKATGPFRTAIPRPNLLKFPGLPAA